jgi:hypothetical protein
MSQCHRTKIQGRNVQWSGEKVWQHVRFKIFTMWFSTFYSRYSRCSPGLSPRDAPYRDNLELIERTDEPMKEAATSPTTVTSLSGSADSSSSSERAASLRRQWQSSRRMPTRRFTIHPHDHLIEQPQQQAAPSGDSSDGRPLGGRQVACCSCGAVQPWPRNPSRRLSQQTTFRVEHVVDVDGQKWVAIFRNSWLPSLLQLS